MITHVGIAIVFRSGWNIQVCSMIYCLLLALFLRSCKDFRINMCQHSQSMQHNKSDGWEFVEKGQIKYVFITSLSETSERRKLDKKREMF